MDKTGGYNQNVRLKAEAERKAREFQSVMLKAAQLRFEAAVPEHFRKQLQAWRDEQVAKIEQAVLESTRAAYPEAAAERERVEQEAAAEYAKAMAAAQAQFEEREAERKAAREAADKAAKQAAWEASPEAREAARRQAEADAPDRVLAGWGFPSFWWSRACWAENVRMMGQDAADREWERTAPMRAACVAADPSTAAALESEQRGAIEAAIVRWEQAHGMTRHAAVDKAEQEARA